MTRASLALAAVLISGCIEIKDKDAKKEPARTQAAATAMDTAEGDISAPSYEEFSLDTAGVGARFPSTPADDSTYGRISRKTVAGGITRFPFRIPKRGAGALEIQVMLDRAHFSPGIIDGMWGDNAARALAFFQSPNTADSSLQATRDSTVSIDKATYDRLRAAAGSEPVALGYTVTADDVKGPFTDIPENVYEQARLQCLCYSSAAEGIAEKFHTSQKLLAQLNPGVKLASLSTGTQLVVPNVDVDVAATGDTASAPKGSNASAGNAHIAKLIVSKKGFWTHAVDSSGTILDHFPSTLGAGYDPSPEGDFHVTSAAWNPPFHYQPTLFAEVPDTRPEARLPRGPNSPVGVVWMALSKPHYGIHGTSAPETIGYANSHGCVRLTNWDATELGRLIGKGTPVEFR